MPAGEAGGEQFMSVRFVSSKTPLGKVVTLFILMAMLAGNSRPAAADQWPARPVTLVLAFAAGAMIDFVGRQLANDVSAAIGQPVVVETKSGAGGAIAALTVAKSPADGYTLLMTAVGPAVLRPLIEKNIGYDTDTDFTPISLVGETPNVLVTDPKLGINSVKELLAYAKTKGNKISIGHAGPGTMGHLCAIVFASKAGLEANFIGYRGTAPMLIDLLGGRIDTGFPGYSMPVQTTKILAVSSEERVEFLPGVPTMKESGIDLVGSTWFGIFGPANMSPEIVAKLNAAIEAFLRKPETRQRFAEAGFRGLGGPPVRLSEMVKKERAKWAQIVASLHLDGDK
jgi:tripartite-type tricarboxylate transporter receptor subunit TctC